MQKFDTIIIGGGPGGTPAAIQLASKGKKVLLVEKSGKLGGACLFVGCIPSKIIKHSADEYALLKTTHLLKEISLEDKKDLWDGIKKKMDEILTLRYNAARQHINKLSNLTFSSGISRFISNDEIEIEEINGTRNRYSFDNAIIATGSLPFIPEFKGNAVQDVLKSEMLFKENALPKSMTIIGGGPIGIELAQMLTKLNVECTIIEMMDTILSGVVEPEFVQALTQKLTASGINVFTSSKVLEINKSGRKYNTIITDKKGLKNVISSEQVMVAAGRIPNVEDLNLGATDIRFNRHGIIVNEFLETSVKGIYATGDVIEGPKFAHTATYEAHIAGANILMGNIHKKDFSKNSWVLFSDPEIASAGYTELEAV
ncbi:MAG: NAD(P)/FAD-dependent oxidoreductase, partial [Calditrichia bacterium]